MHKKLAATLTIAIFLASTLAVILPVQAHYTLGNAVNTTPYHVADFDPHVPGVIGYVWPGGGEDAYLASLPYGAAVSSSSASPGYVAPWADGGKNPPGAPSSTWYQLAGNAYAPFGAILVNSTGDLIFAINATYPTTTAFPTGYNTGIGDCNTYSAACPTLIFTSTGAKLSNQTALAGGWGWRYWDILVPPEFGSVLKSQVVTTLSNEYNRISVSTLDQNDRYAPGWTLIRVSTDNYAVFPTSVGGTPVTATAVADNINQASLVAPTDPTLTDNPIGEAINFTQAGQWYYVRVNGVTAPSIAGKYFFKMFLGGYGVSGDCSSKCLPDYWLPTQNWPVLLVKGEVDPAIAYGTIFYGGYNATLYNTPIMEAGMVKFQMTTKLDPYTGNKLTGYPLVNAVGYFNATANGHFEVEGIAPGIYDVYASAGGYPTQLIATGVTIQKGQSLNLNGYLNPGPVLHGTVYTKHGFGEEPWPRSSYIKIEIYNAPTVGFQVSSSATLVSWSPLPCVASGPGARYAGSSAYNGQNDAITGQYIKGSTLMQGNLAAPNGGYECGGNNVYTTPFSTPVGFPYQDSGTFYGTTTTPVSNKVAIGATPAPGTVPAPAGWVLLADGTYVQADDMVYNKAGTTPAGDLQPNIDVQGVGPAQSWIVQGGTSTPFQWQFGVKGEYGAPSQMDGHVPQMNATWVNGLTAGRYYARAWTVQYVQSEIDGATFHEVYFDVSAQEWAGDIAVPIDMRLTSFVNKTVYFHDTPGTLQTSPADPSSSNPLGGTGATVLSGGLYDANNVLWAWNDTFWASSAAPSKVAIYFYGWRYTWIGRDYGIPAGSYTPKVYAKGYRQQTFEQVSLSLSGQQVMISDHLYRGVGFNLTVYSTDFEQPRVDRNWVWDGAPIDLNIYYMGSVTPLPTVTTATGTVSTQDDFFTQKGTVTFVKGSASGLVQGGVFWGSDPSKEEGGSASRSDVFITGHGPGSGSTGTSYDSGTYSFRAGTQGYVQDKNFTAAALKGQVADIKINLVVAVNITVVIPFKKENILTPTANNMQGRIRVFDDSGRILAEWMSSMGLWLRGVTPVTASKWSGAGAITASANSWNFIPAGTTTLTVILSGLPDDIGEPIFSSGFELNSPATAAYAIGIPGSPDYNGGYNIEVDFVNLWNAAPVPTTGTPALKTGVAFYPPVAGLLMGESFHTVPGHPQNAFGWTEVGALSKTYLGRTMAPNHLGPYLQEGMWTLPNAHLSGSVSGEWEVDQRGYLAGTMVGFTWSGEFRTISWATVSIQGADNYTYKAYSWDGFYEFYTAPGSYKMTIAAPGYSPQSFSVAVSSGQATVGGNVFLQQTNVPVPEFTGLAVVAFSALAASLYLLRRRHR